MTLRYVDEVSIKTKFRLLSSSLNERSRRMWAATEASSFGRGGIAAVCRATGLDHKTVQRGIRELHQANPPDAEQIRQPGGGRKTLIASHPDILQALESLVESAVRGDPESQLRWVSKSAYHLADALRAQNYAVSPRSISTLLKAAGYSLQAKWASPRIRLSLR